MGSAHKAETEFQYVFILDVLMLGLQFLKPGGSHTSELKPCVAAALVFNISIEASPIYIMKFFPPLISSGQ